MIFAGVAALALLWTLLAFVLSERQQRIEHNLQGASSVLVCELNPPPTSRDTARYLQLYGSCADHMRLHMPYVPALKAILASYNQREAGSHIHAAASLFSSSGRVNTDPKARWITRNDMESGYLLVRHGGNVYEVLSAPLVLPRTYARRHAIGFYSITLQLGFVDRLLSRFVDQYG